MHLSLYLLIGKTKTKLSQFSLLQAHCSIRNCLGAAAIIHDGTTGSHSAFLTKSAPGRGCLVTASCLGPWKAWGLLSQPLQRPPSCFSFFRVSSVVPQPLFSVHTQWASPTRRARELGCCLAPVPLPSSPRLKARSSSELAKFSPTFNSQSLRELGSMEPALWQLWKFEHCSLGISGSAAYK